MRDLLDLITNLSQPITEAALAAGEMGPKKMSAVKDPKTGNLMTRQQLFLYKVMNSSPFQTKDGREVIIDPREATNVSVWIQGGMSKPIKMQTIDGNAITNTSLQKTVEFGSKESEQIKIKGSDIFNTDDTDVEDLGNRIENILDAGGFPAIDMYRVLAESQHLNKLGKVGKAIISMAKQISEGQIPMVPTDLSEQEIKAIELYASEYLGVLGLVSRIVPFKQGNRESFDEFLGMDISEMIVYFPKSVSNPLADSFTITNDETGHSLKISSKAAGKGAPPSLTSLKLPDDVREKYPEAARFLDSAQDSSVSTFAQPFAMMNAMMEVNPENVPKAYATIMPFSDDLINELESTLKTNKKLPEKLMKLFYSQLSEQVINSDNTDGGKAWYAVTTDIIEAVNKGSAVANLREALIESLGYNFIQLYTNVKKGQMITEAFWPAKLNGNVKLKTKGSAADPKKGKLSVEISPGKESEKIEIGSSTSTGGEQPKARFKDPGASMSADVVKRPGKSPKEKTSLGRERR
jgi:hypothetical protein